MIDINQDCHQSWLCILSPLTAVIQSELRINWGLFGYIHGGKWPRWRAYDIYTLLYFIVILLYTILESKYKCFLKLCIIILSHTDLIKESLNFYDCFVSLLQYRIFRLQGEEREAMPSPCRGRGRGRGKEKWYHYC